MKFDPEKSLFELPAVKTVALYTAASVLLVILLILATSNLSFQPGYLGINNLVEIFKVPLGILAVGLSIIGLCGANHRSEQTRRQIERTARQIDLSTQQIEATKSQNNFANYYKHAEEFSKLCSSFKEIGKVKSPKRLHAKLFPSSLHGDFKIKSNINADFEEYGQQLKGCLLEMSNENNFDQLWNIQKINHSFAKVYFLNSVEFSDVGSNVLLKSGVIYMPPNGVIGYLRAHLDFVNAVDEILGFDITHQTPTIISRLSNLGLGFVSSKLDGNSSINFPSLLDGYNNAEC